MTRKDGDALSPEGFGMTANSGEIIEILRPLGLE